MFKIFFELSELFLFHLILTMVYDRLMLLARNPLASLCFPLLNIIWQEKTTKANLKEIITYALRKFFPSKYFFFNLIMYDNMFPIKKFSKCNFLYSFGCCWHLACMLFFSHTFLVEQNIISFIHKNIQINSTFLIFKHFNLK